METVLAALSFLGGFKGSAASTATSAEVTAANAQTKAAQESLSTWKWVFIGSLGALLVLIVVLVILKRK